MNSDRRAPVIALVDDDRHILASVSMMLAAEGYTVTTYSDGESALRGLSTQPAALAVLDIKMPRMDGMELLRRLRKEGDLPIIFLTSKDDEMDEIQGLRLGADDYISKPFSQQLLLERIRSVLRRHDSRKEPETPLVRGHLQLDIDRCSCRWKGKPVNLTVTEFLLLESLVRFPGHVKSRDMLMDAAYGNSAYALDRAIDSHIKRLRKKFREVDPEFGEIETMYGMGYRFRQT